jgi:hypothetical protein
MQPELLYHVCFALHWSDCYNPPRHQVYRRCELPLSRNLNSVPLSKLTAVVVQF